MHQFPEVTLVANPEIFQQVGNLPMLQLRSARRGEGLISDKSMASWSSQPGGEDIRFQARSCPKPVNSSSQGAASVCNFLQLPSHFPEITFGLCFLFASVSVLVCFPLTRCVPGEQGVAWKVMGRPLLGLRQSWDTSRSREAIRDPNFPYWCFAEEDGFFECRQCVLFEKLRHSSSAW